MPFRRRLEAIWTRARRAGRALPRWVLALALAVVASGGVVVADPSDEVTAAAFGLLGVLLGAAIGAAAAIAATREAARETARAGIAGAALPRRIRAHQEAFVLWRRLAGATNGPEEDLRTIVENAAGWWERNCFYLSREASLEFNRLIANVQAHRRLLADHRAEGSDATREAVLGNWHAIKDVGRLLTEGVGNHISDEMLARLAPPPA